MEAFSQSRGDDDLFDDEIVPIDTPSQAVEDVTTQVEQVSLESAQTQLSKETLPAQGTTSASRGRGRGRGRARGGLSKDQPKPGGLADSKYAPRAPPPVPKTSNSQPSDKQTPSSSVVGEPTSEDPSQSDDGPSSTAPTGPSNPTPARPPAVRGDRTATGGIRKPKLTEEELSVKIAAAKERSQNLAAAHARAQADADNFAERERLATEKRAKESEARKVLQGERERNRERKLRALGGREWDAGKDEQQDILNPNTRGPPPRRMGDFNEEAHDLSIYEWNEDRGRGGGGRGRGRGRGGRGRGGRDRGSGTDIRQDRRGGFPHVTTQAQPDINAETDFPALPSTTTTTTAMTNKKTVTSSDQKRPTATVRKSSAAAGGGGGGGAGGGSWADQVESSEAAAAAKG